jgi:hypothetical protein
MAAILNFFKKIQLYLVIWNIFHLNSFLLDCAIAEIQRNRKWWPSWIFGQLFLGHFPSFETHFIVKVLR